MNRKKYKVIYTFGPGVDQYEESYYTYPDVGLYICPSCGAHPMRYSKEDLGEWDGWRTVYSCVICGAQFNEGDKRLKPVQDENKYAKQCIQKISYRFGDIIVSSEIKKFNSLKKFKELGFTVSVEDDAVLLYKDVKEHMLNTIHFSTRFNSQKTYLNGFGLTRDELELINLFWEEYDELIEDVEDDGF